MFQLTVLAEVPKADISLYLSLKLPQQTPWGAEVSLADHISDLGQF